MHRFLLIAVALAALVLAACGPGTGPAASTAPGGSPAAEKVQITDKTKDELQAVIKTQREALVKRDLAAYQGTFDGQRLAFRRCKAESFETAGRIGASSNVPRIVKVEPYLETYARAYLDMGANGVSRVYFRRDAGRWVQTEPKKDELGGEKKKTVAGIDVEYWGIDEDVSDAFGRGAVAARDAVLKNTLAEAKG